MSLLFCEVCWSLPVHYEVKDLLQNENLRDEPRLKQKLVESSSEQVLVNIHTGAKIDLQLGKLSDHRQHVIHVEISDGQIVTSDAFVLHPVGI